MRRLPIYLVLDVSESMAGEPIENVQAGIRMLLEALMSDPYALETAYLSVIAFAGTAKVMVPLTALLDFQIPRLPIGSGTNLAPALKLLMREIDTKVKRNTTEAKGDWRPLVFFLTDGAPNDNYIAAAQEWRTKYGNKISTVAVLMGINSDASALKLFTDHVLVFKDTSKKSYQAFFRWVSASIQTSSKAIGEKGKEVSFSEQLSENMAKDLIAESLPVSNTVEYFVIVCRCQQSAKPYFLRYRREKGEKLFSADGTFELDENYFDVSAPGEGRQIKLEMFSNLAPECPYCKARRLGLCECGKWFCVDSSNEVKCPWCKRTMTLSGGAYSWSGGLG